LYGIKYGVNLFFKKIVL